MDGAFKLKLTNQKGRDRSAWFRNKHHSSILKVKDFHRFVLRGCDENVVSELGHGAHKVFVLSVHGEEVICCGRRSLCAFHIVLTLITA